MLIGLDFDNTIVSYDQLFHTVATEQGLVPDGTVATKLAVRDHLRRIGEEDRWTEIQGYVYGARMAEAKAFPGVHDFLRLALRVGVEVAIVSHKTRHPFRGPRYNLHAAAASWLEVELADKGRPLVDPANVFFEVTKDDKLKRIGAIGCDLFVDDLPEILGSPGFPPATRGILFDPDGVHAPGAASAVVSDWDELACWLPKTST